MGKIIGQITEVNGLSIKAELFELLPPYLTSNHKIETAPKINGFVKTSIGLDEAVCQVVGEYNKEGSSKYCLSLEVKGYLRGERFIQGLRILPIVSAKVELLDSEDYNRMFYPGSSKSIKIGCDLYDESKDVKVGINKIIPSHVGVFGNTGSGKSNTLAKVLSSYFDVIKEEETKAGKFIVFDLNNEYGSSAICEECDKTIYNLSTSEKGSSSKIPLNITDLDEDDFVIMMNATQKTQTPVIKTAYARMKEKRDERYYKNLIKTILISSKQQLFNSMKYYLSEYIKNIDDFKYHSKSAVFYYRSPNGDIYSNTKEFDAYVDKIEIDLPTEQIDRFLFELYFAVAHEFDNGVGLEFMMPLISRARKLISDFKKVFDFTQGFHTIFKDKKVCVIQLSSVNKDMKEIIPAVVAENVFKRLQSKKEESGEVKQIINLVVDEAHTLLYENDKKNPAHESVLDTFERIVKEGRKFGLFLFVSSQRPSDISQTIISQLHNYFIHKLVNPGDISMIRKAVAYMDEHALDFITILAPGECIVSGTAFQMPAFIYIDQVEEERRPISANVVLIGNNGLFERKDTEKDAF